MSDYEMLALTFIVILIAVSKDIPPSSFPDIRRFYNWEATVHQCYLLIVPIALSAVKEGQVSDRESFATQLS